MYFSLMQNKVINFLPMPEIKPEMLSDAEVSFFRNYLTNWSLLLIAPRFEEHPQEKRGSDC